MTIKKIISTICASVFAFSCFGFNVNAKVIEPEIVKTESWYSSYRTHFYDSGNSYPFLKVDCDIYSDGSVYVYLFFEYIDTTNSDSLFVIEPEPLPNRPYYKYTEGTGSNFEWSSELYPANYYPNEYKIQYSSFLSFYNNGDSNKWYRFYYEKTDSKRGLESSDCQPDAHISTACNAPEAHFNEKRKTNCAYILKPISDVTTSMNFHLYGHDIQITPELLSGNIVAEPELTEQEKYIKQLEEENSKLKTEIESYKKLDFDGDGLLTNADAQMILVYYTNSLVGKTTGKVEDYSEYVKQISG